MGATLLCADAVTDGGDECTDRVCAAVGGWLYAWMGVEEHRGIGVGHSCAFIPKDPPSRCTTKRVKRYVSQNRPQRGGQNSPHFFYCDSESPQGMNLHEGVIDLHDRLDGHNLVTLWSETISHQRTVDCALTPSPCQRGCAPVLAYISCGQNRWY